MLSRMDDLHAAVTTDPIRNPPNEGNPGLLIHLGRKSKLLLGLSF